MCIYFTQTHMHSAHMGVKGVCQAFNKHSLFPFTFFSFSHTCILTNIQNAHAHTHTHTHTQTHTHTHPHTHTHTHTHMYFNKHRDVVKREASVEGKVRLAKERKKEIFFDLQAKT
jgi:hypothetical protein